MVVKKDVEDRPVLVCCRKHKMVFGIRRNHVPNPAPLIIRHSCGRIIFRAHQPQVAISEQGTYAPLIVKRNVN